MSAINVPRLRERKRTVANQVVGKMYRANSPYTTWTLYKTYNLSNAFTTPISSRVERTFDVNHGSRPRNEAYTVGGPFNLWLYDTTACIPTSPITLEGGGKLPGDTKYRYFGSFVNSYVPVVGSLPNYYNNPGIRPHCTDDYGNSTWGDASSYGATGWSKYRPGQRSATVAEFIGEISDLPRMLKTTAMSFYDLYRGRFGRTPKGAAKKAADNWLNHQFGWMPFLHDVRRFYKTWQRADQLVRQLIVDNGQWIRRHGTVAKSSSVGRLIHYGPSSLGTTYPSFVEPNFFLTNQAGTMDVDNVITQRFWFEGTFKYWIPNVESVAWRKSVAKRIYGTDVTPAVVWELIPWSWLVDWFTNVGDIISNVDNGLVHNLVAKFAYVMGTTEQNLRIHSVLNTVFSGTLSYDWCISLVRKHRTEANPFGFGLSDSMLSARQWGILSALGILRLH